MSKPQIDTLKADLAILAALEAKALSKQLFAAYGAYRREHARLSDMLAAAVQS